LLIPEAKDFDYFKATKQITLTLQCFRVSMTNIIKNTLVRMKLPTSGDKKKLRQ